MATFSQILDNLPDDIIVNIFTRLPVKSLSRFKCVSKSVHALLRDPTFAKQHLLQAILQYPNLILKLGSKLFYVGDEDWSGCRRLELPFASSLDQVELSGSCNGLLCISDQESDEDIFLYNPVTQESKKLPFPDFDLSTIKGSTFTTVGLGYCSEEDDYKVLRCVYFYDKPLNDIDSYDCEARVYSLRTDKWKKLEDVPFHLAGKAAVWLGNEFLVWKATRGLGRRGIVMIASYDMGKEEFKEIPQPDANLAWDGPMDLGVLNGCLSIFYNKSDDGSVHVWSMKEYGVKESWTKLFVIERPSDMVNVGYVLFRPLTTLKGGKILVDASERAKVLYDPENETFNTITIRGAPRRYSMTPVVGSLVSPVTFGAENA